jgi:phage/plasmid-like protein (TIGR03299 family)
MAHEIVNNMMAYVGAKPWHGLGFEVPVGATGQQMLEIAGLNWLVQRRAIAMRPVNADGTVDTSTFLKAELDSYRAIVRADTNQVFQVASDRYHPVQNAEIVDFFREYCEAGHASIETLGGLRNGAVVWALAKLNGGSTATLAGVDELRGYMLLATSHDGSLLTIGKPTQTRVVCWNTLSASLGLHGGKLGKVGDKEFRMRHTRKFGPSERENAQKTMGMAIEQVQATNELAAKLSTVKIDERGRTEFVNRLLGTNAGATIETTIKVAEVDHSAMGKSILDSIILNTHIASVQAKSSPIEVEEFNRVGKAIIDAIVSSPGANLSTAKDTLWGAVNGVTYYADHAAKTRSDGNRMFSSWFGPNETLKRDAVTIAADMAGISAN